VALGDAERDAEMLTTSSDTVSFLTRVLIQALGYRLGIIRMLSS